MLAVALGENEANSYLSRLSAGRFVVACCDSSSSTTVSGDEEAIVELQNKLETLAITARIINVDAAYHSHHIQAVAEQYLRRIEGLQYGIPNPSIQFYSSVTAEAKDSDFGPSYWVQNLVSKVRFCNALERLCHEMLDDATPESPCLNFVEIGPHSTLTGPVKQTITHLKLQHVRFNCTSVLHRDRDSQLTFLQSLGHLFEHGCSVDLGTVNSLDDFEQSRNVITNLPPYPFDQSGSPWFEPPVSRKHRYRSQPYHDLLGLRLPDDTSIEPTWRHRISVESLPWLQEHVVESRTVFPASGYIAMAIEAKRQFILENSTNVFEFAHRYVLKDLKFVST